MRDLRIRSPACPRGNPGIYRCALPCTTDSSSCLIIGCKSSVSGGVPTDAVRFPISPGTVDLVSCRVLAAVAGPGRGPTRCQRRREGGGRKFTGGVRRRRQAHPARSRPCQGAACSDCSGMALGAAIISHKRYSGMDSGGLSAGSWMSRCAVCLGSGAPFLMQHSRRRPTPSLAV